METTSRPGPKAGRMTPFSIRSAKPADLPHIQTILDHYVKNTVVTFLETTPTLEALQKELEQLEEKDLPYLVAVPHPVTDASSVLLPEVLGYINAHPYNASRAAFDHTAELAILVHPSFRIGGIGTALMKGMLAHLNSGTRVKQLISTMTVDVDGLGGGLALRDWYVRFGMREVGRLKEVGTKFGKWIDIIILQAAVGAT